MAAAVAAAMAAAGARRSLRGPALKGTLKLVAMENVAKAQHRPHLLLTRRVYSQPSPGYEARNPKVPSEEISLFTTYFKKSLTKFVETSSEAELAKLMADLSTALNECALKNGVFYPTELANLVATFVPVRGHYEPYNSKLVVVDLVNRMEKLEVTNARKTTMVYAFLSGYLLTILYVPYSFHELRSKCNAMKSRVDSMEIRLAELEGKLVHSVKDMKERMDSLEQRMTAIEEV